MPSFKSARADLLGHLQTCLEMSAAAIDSKPLGTYAKKKEGIHTKIANAEELSGQIYAEAERRRNTVDDNQLTGLAQSDFAVRLSIVIEAMNAMFTEIKRAEH